MKIIARGAEAILLRKKESLLKKRVKKSYRHPLLDSSLRKSRTRREARILNKISNIVAVPKVLTSNEETIEMEFLNGKLLSSYLDSFNSKQRKKVSQDIGKTVAKLHAANIIHGDLTTSNMILKDKLYFIDFGLSFHSTKVEDKAVDIHLLKEALNSKHFKISDNLFKEFTKSYSKHYNEGKKVLSRLEVVEKRGLYKRKNML